MAILDTTDHMAMAMDMDMDMVTLTAATDTDMVSSIILNHIILLL